MNALDDALQTAQATKQAYRDGQASRDDHRAAAADLRYQRWLARSGPDEETRRLDGGESHTNGEVAGMYQRWLAESREG